MTLCDAMRNGLEKGKAITRDEWKNTAVVRLVDGKPILKWDDGSMLPWNIDTLDFISTDYRVVEGFLNEN